MERSSRIISDEDSAVIVAINSLGDRFSREIQELGNRLDQVIKDSQVNAVNYAGLQSKVAGLHRIIWFIITASTTAHTAVVVSLLTDLL